MRPVYRFSLTRTPNVTPTQYCLRVDGNRIGWLVMDETETYGQLTIRPPTVLGTHMLERVSDFFKKRGWMISLNGQTIGWS